MSEYDFIVAGGGTAGLCVAGRLAEGSNVSVLVVEAGKDNPHDVDEISTPGLAFNLVESEYDWAYETKLIDRPDFQRTERHNTRGKVLGGSSSLNYYSWMRGSRGTYDEWAAYGGEDWNFDNCLSYLRKTASFHDDDNVFIGEHPASSDGSGSQDAPLKVCHEKSVPLEAPLQEGWKSRGLNMTTDIFSGTVDGLCHIVRTIYDGVRSSSTCFLEGKPNITVLTERKTTKIIIEDDTAVGIEVEGTNGTERYRARHDVIVSCGVFETPKLIMLSGVGPQKELYSHDIECLVNSPNVGRNLQDHPIVPHVFHVKDGYGMDHFIRHGPEHHEAVAEYKKTREGGLSCGFLENSGFKRIDERLTTCKEWRERKEQLGYDPLGPRGQPHFEFDFLPVFAKPFQPHITPPPTGHYMTVVVSLLRPLSRGTVSLRSQDPMEQPNIFLNFLSDELEIVALREGVRFIDEVLLKGDGTKDIILGEYPEPIPRESDEKMQSFILGRVSTGYHPCGTCRLGKTIDQGVIDNRLRVFGISKLRVADASAIPIIPDGRIQNPVYMIAEKCAAMIKEDYPSIWPEPPAIEKGAATVQRKMNSFLDGLREAVTENSRVLRSAWS